MSFMSENGSKENNEVERVTTHLELLRNEYVNLQQKLADTERKLSAATASADSDTNDFASCLLKAVSNLLNDQCSTDLTVRFKDFERKVHKFVLGARSRKWNGNDLNDVDHIDFPDFNKTTGEALITWVYTDCLDCDLTDIDLVLDLLKCSKQLNLSNLTDRCQQALIPCITKHNCINFYKISYEIGAEIVQKHCSELISNYWTEFTSEDFKILPAKLTYVIFKQKVNNALHSIVRFGRDDVLMLYLLEYDALLPSRLDELDMHGDVALDLALKLNYFEIAKTLVKYGANVDRKTIDGYYLLHKAIIRSDENAALFLIDNNCQLNVKVKESLNTPLHLVANSKNSLTNIANKLLMKNADVNIENANGDTPLHITAREKNEKVFDSLLQFSKDKLDFDKLNSEGKTALWLTLTNNSKDFGENSMAAKLLKHGASPNTLHGNDRDCLLQLLARLGDSDACIFLVANNAKINWYNSLGESTLHTACATGLTSLVRVLLDAGSNLDAMTTAPVYGQESTKLTALHLAILQRHENVVDALLESKSIVVNCRDSQGGTPLGYALWQGLHNIAEKLVKRGAGVAGDEGALLLRQAIERKNTEAALFILKNGARTDSVVVSNCLELAVKNGLKKVVEELCERGVDKNLKDSDGNRPLYTALKHKFYDVADVLVSAGCDVDGWDVGPSNCLQTLLHRAIDESNQDICCYLINKGCDVNSPRRPGLKGEGDSEAYDGQRPLHLAASWGLENVVERLVSSGSADVNAQDSEGQTPLHVAIDNQHAEIIQLLMSNDDINFRIRDKKSITPFALAMLRKNEAVAKAIVRRQKDAAEEKDNKGRTFLHLAIEKNNIESVLFLLALGVNVNSHDNDGLSPLHISVGVNNEMIVRNLILAAAKIDDRTPQKKTALHLAAEKDRANICMILLENNADYNAVDSMKNNALHCAVQYGHVETVRVLLTNCNINAEAVNCKGENPLHVLASMSPERAPAIFQLFMETMPNYPFNEQDANGNTPLILAYVRPHVQLARDLVKAGAKLGVTNDDGLSIFNAPVASKSLLVKLLDTVAKEPPWTDGENCLECNIKFGLATRKHHCRHCGRLCCSKCSDKEMPIIKFNLSKPVRVCKVCFAVLNGGTIQ